MWRNIYTFFKNYSNINNLLFQKKLYIAFFFTRIGATWIVSAIFEKICSFFETLVFRAKANAEQSPGQNYLPEKFSEISQNSQENTCARVSFLIKFQAQACNFIKKETLTQVFSCQLCKIFKNTFFYRTPPGDCFYLDMFCRKGALKNFANFTGKHACRSLFLIKLQAYRLTCFYEKYTLLSVAFKSLDFGLIGNI